MQSVSTQVCEKGTDDTSVDTLSRLFSFVVGGSDFALETSYVREIKRVHQITPIPEKKEGLIGFTALRGSVLPVFDGHVLFDVELSSEVGQDFCNGDIHTLLVLEIYGEGRVVPRLVGVVVDDVTEVTDIAADRISPAPEQGTCTAIGEAGAESIIGLYSVQGSETMTVIVDPAKLINFNRMRQVFSVS